MRTPLSAAVIGVILVLALASVPMSSPNMNVKFALHLAPHGDHTCTTNPVAINGFTDITREVESWDPESGLDVFLVVFDYDSITVVEYGLTWPSEWGTASTRVCVPNALVVGSITYPGDGIAFAWWAVGSTCKISDDYPGGNTPAFFVPSYSWMLPTGPGEIRIKDNPVVEMAGVVDCDPEYCGRGYEYVTHVYDAGVQMVPHEGPYPGSCFVIPTALHFGTVNIGKSSDRTFVIGNNGSAPISGTVSASPDDYSIVGDKTYSLTTGQSKQFTVRFAPTEIHPAQGVIETGCEHCDNIVCCGAGAPPVSTEPTTWGAIKSIFR